MLPIVMRSIEQRPKRKVSNFAARQSSASAFQRGASLQTSGPKTISDVRDLSRTLRSACEPTFWPFAPLPLWFFGCFGPFAALALWTPPRSEQNTEGPQATTNTVSSLSEGGQMGAPHWRWSKVLFGLIDLLAHCAPNGQLASLGRRDRSVEMLARSLLVWSPKCTGQFSAVTTTVPSWHIAADSWRPLVSRSAPLSHKARTKAQPTKWAQSLRFLSPLSLQSGRLIGGPSENN